MFALAFLAIFAATVSAGEVDVQPCSDSSRGPIPLAVRIDGCSRGQMCQFHAGDVVKVEIDFKSNQDSETIFYDATAQTPWGITVGLPMDSHEGCVGLEPPCPIHTGNFHTLRFEQKVPKNQSKMKNSKITLFARGEKGALGCGWIRADIG